MEEKKKYRKIFILIASLVACIVLYIVEQGVEVNYAIKTFRRIFF